MISGRREKFTNFELKETNDSDVHRKQVFTTDMVLEVSSTFYIHALFTGNYDKGCGLTFNLVDNDDYSMYHLDFRLHNKHSYKKLIVGSKIGANKWSEGFEANLPDLARENEIYVLVTEKYYVLTINRKEIEQKFEVDLNRLRRYKGIMIKYYGKCMHILTNKSYMTNGGNDCFISDRINLKHHLNISSILNNGFFKLIQIPINPLTVSFNKYLIRLLDS